MWAQRESIVSIIAVNGPSLNGLFRRESWSSNRSNSGTPMHNSGSHAKSPAKFAVYKMTNFGTSEESTSELVDASQVNGVETNITHNTMKD
jgi:hypothetical protein